MARPKKAQETTVTTEVTVTEINTKQETVKMFRNPSKHAIHTYDVPLAEVEQFKMFEWQEENKWL